MANLVEAGAGGGYVWDAPSEGGTEGDGNCFALDPSFSFFYVLFPKICQKENVGNVVDRKSVV